MKKWIHSLTALCLLAGMLCFTAGCEAPIPADTAYIDSSNIFGGGYCASSGATHLCSSRTTKGLYKLNSDGKATKQFSNTSASYINATEDYIYCIDNSIGIVRMDKNGKNRITNLEDLAKYLNVTQTEMYYYDIVTSCVKRVQLSDISESNRRTPYQVVLNRAISQLYIYDGNMYFVDSEGEAALTRIPLSSLNELADETKQYEDVAEVLVQERVSQFVIYGNKIYYTKQSITMGEVDDSASGIFRTDLDGSNNEVITEENASCFVILNDIIYFVRPNYRSYSSLMTISIADNMIGSPEEQAVDNPTSLCITDNFVIMDCSADSYNYYRAVKQGRKEFKYTDVE